MAKKIDTDLDADAGTKAAPTGRRPCRVCKVTKAVSELDRTNRCHSCATAKAATDEGMTYGKYQGQRYAAVLNAQNKKAKNEQELEKKLKTPRDFLCLNCSGIIPASSSEQEFCCQRCRIEYEKRERDAKERGAVAQPAPPNYCRQCGKEIPRKNKYCNETCKYLFNQERMKQRQKERAEAKAKERPAVFCRHCGKEILSKRRSAYCSDSCANAGHIEQKRKNRRNKKEEKGNE